MRLVLATILLLAVCCGLAVADVPATQPTYMEALRPQFHFSPARGWMNDPNGLVWFDGEYHLFFQHNADSLTQVPVMSWGHAASTDLLHWKQLPIALSPDDRGWIWSGSTAIDWHDTSGFGVGDQPPMVAMYTAARDPFAQCIAYSTDRGRTFTKFSGNPVIANIANHNRDPHLIWHEPTRQWIVVLFKDVGNTFCIYHSSDLKHWEHLQDVNLPGCTECPDFFPLPLDGDPSKTKWVFTAANGHYLVGSFDGKRFSPEQDVRQVDFGRNYYAVQTYSDIPPSDGRRIQIAWMMGGKYPDMPFNQQMSFPAELSLRSSADGPRLYREPAREIEQLHAGRHDWNDQLIRAGQNALADAKGELLDIRLDVDLGDASEIDLTVHGQSIAYDVKSQKLSALGEATVAANDHRLQLQILVDRTSIETFAKDGQVSFTSCYLPSGDDSVTLSAKGGNAHLRSATIYPLKSIWR